MRDDHRLCPPPRSVPWSLRTVVLLGGVRPAIGWLLLGMGLVFVMVFAGNAEPLFSDPFGGPVSSMRGTVTEVRATAVKVNRRRVAAVHFEYGSGEPRQRGVSYTLEATPDPGSEVELEVARTRPAVARIVGMRTHPMPAWLHGIVVLPLAGVVVLLLSLRKGFARVRLLQQGEVAQATLVDQQATNASINNRRVHRLTFRFVDRGKRERLVVARTHRTEALTDEPSETVLHDPDGDGALLLDDLPARTTIDAQGQLEPTPLGRVLLVLIAPALVALVVALASRILAQFGPS
jgi:hypothetical protein